MKLQEGWAIIGSHGLYVGWHPIRREMIAQHLADLYDMPRFTLSGKLSQAQTELWRKCQRKGDRAIKICISYR